MSTGWVIAGAAVVGAIGSYSSSKKASKSASKQLNWEKQMYTQSSNYLTGQMPGANVAFDSAIDTLKFGAGGCASAALATAYDAEAYDMKAFMATAYEVEMDGFIQAFKEAEDINSISMDTFNRRYGQIMDNVKQSILDVEQGRISAGGRQQLAIDATTLAQNFDQQMVKKGMSRTGISVEMEKRMAMETAKQARDIDTQSYEKANVLQSQGVNTLNSMTAARENIAARGEMIEQNKAHGILTAEMQDAALKTNVDMQNAQNKTLASQVNAQNRTNVSITNATNRTNVSMQNAANLTNASLTNAQIASNKQLSLANLYAQKWSTSQNAINSFYSGQPGAGVSSAYAAQTAQYSADAAGFATAAGWAAGKAYDTFGD